MAFTVDNLEVTSKGLTCRVLFKTMTAQDFIKKVRDAVNPIMQESADHIAEQAAKNAPKHEGEDHNDLVLSESLTGKARKKGTGFKVRTNTRVKGKRGRTGYGADIEFGDSRIEAKPFLYPAYDAEMKVILEHLRNIL